MLDDLAAMPPKATDSQTMDQHSEVCRARFQRTASPPPVTNDPAVDPDSNLEIGGTLPKDPSLISLPLKLSYNRLLSSELPQGVVIKRWHRSLSPI
jgi:hypothetical protein